VRLEGERVHGARVQQLDRRQLLLVLLHQVSQPGRRHFREIKIVDRWNDNENLRNGFSVAIMILIPPNFEAQLRTKDISAPSWIFQGKPEDFVLWCIYVVLHWSCALQNQNGTHNSSASNWMNSELTQAAARPGHKVDTNLNRSFPRSRALILLHSPFLKASSAAFTALSTSSFEAASTCRKQREKLWLKLGDVQGISKRTPKDAHRLLICKWLIHNVTTRRDRFQTKIIFLAVKEGLMLIAGVRRWKLHLSDSTWCQVPIDGDWTMNHFSQIYQLKKHRGHSPFGNRTQLIDFS
jgi:hypothetical protein